MTQDEIIRMAREAQSDTQRHFGDRWSSIGRSEFMSVYNENLANLVAEATKEKAAKVCEELHLIWDAKGANEQCAAAIRSMK